MALVRFRALACDFDGTIATDGAVAPATLTALERVRGSGRRLLLVTGRTGPQLEAVFGRWDVFDRIVLENGALLVDPSTGAERLLCAPVSDHLVHELRRRGVEPMAVGRAICAAGVAPPGDDPGCDPGLSAFRSTTVVNRGGVVVLPVGVSKASGTAHRAPRGGGDAGGVRRRRRRRERPPHARPGGVRGRRRQRPRRGQGGVRPGDLAAGRRRHRRAGRRLAGRRPRRGARRRSGGWGRRGAEPSHLDAVARPPGGGRVRCAGSRASTDPGNGVAEP